VKIIPRTRSSPAEYATPSIEFDLIHRSDAEYSDYGSTAVTIHAINRPNPQCAWGTPGTFDYRYQLCNPNVGVIDWSIDPYAR